MAKNVLRSQFSNMYGKDKPFQSNTSSVKLSNESENVEVNSNQVKRTLKNEFKNVYGEKTPEKSMFPEIKPSNMTVSAIIFLTVSIILVSILYYYRNNIFDFFQRTKNTISKTDTVAQLESKYDSLFDSINKKIEEDDKELSEIKSKLNAEVHTIEKDEKKEKETKTKIDTGGVGTLNAKIETKYKDNQIVKGNGYCYIGFDNHMRECTDVYEGDICMSGQIFPTLDVCVNPEFRP
jgi:Skp family chaperone for outer membrane proteins